MTVEKYVNKYTGFKIKAILSRKIAMVSGNTWKILLNYGIDRFGYYNYELNMVKHPRISRMS